MLETGHDILFIWVARMVMMGLHLTGTLPFKKVFLHAMIRDAHGRKMSKSLGNVVDPMDVIRGMELDKLIAGLGAGNLPPAEVEKASRGMEEDFPKGIPECGTDALRFGLASYTGQSHDINLNIRVVETYRQFCNKLWNATRFALTHLGEDYVPSAERGVTGDESAWDKWILSRLSVALEGVDKGVVEFNMSAATYSAHSWWLGELCDIYLEVIKPVMAGDDAKAKGAAQATLYTCLDEGLKMLHSFMPYVTEELWQRLPHRASETAPSIMLTAYPTPSQRDVAIEETVSHAMKVVRAGRSLKAAYNEKELRTPQLTIVAKDAETAGLFVGEILNAIATLTKASSLTVAEVGPAGCAVEVISPVLEVHMTVKGIIDISQEIGNLTERLDKLTNSLSIAEKAWANLDPSKVPEDRKDAMKSKIVDLTSEKAVFERAISDLRKL